MSLTICVCDAHGAIKNKSIDSDEVFLLFNSDYAEGDYLSIETTEPQRHIFLQLDDTLAPSLVFLKGHSFRLPVPFGLDRQPYSLHAFTGGMSKLSARYAYPEEISVRRNLALNSHDWAGNGELYPHAHANAVTRGEAQFAARNAIDGIKATYGHGKWPYTSWGIDKRPDAEITVEFGRKVLLDEVKLYLRADWKQDSWWRQVSLSLSDGTGHVFATERTGEVQPFAFPAREVEWAKLHSLVKADDPSDLPALTQIELWGREL